MGRSLLRLAAVSLARNPGGAAVTATFLVASLGLAIFVAQLIARRSSQGQHDEAYYAALAAVCRRREDLAQLMLVLHGWNGGPATPLVRLSGNVPSAAGFTFLAMPWSSLPATGGWRGDFASQSLPQLAKAIRPGFSTALRSTKLPPGKEFTLRGARTRGDDIGIRAFFRSPLGDFVQIPLGATNGARRIALHGRIPFACTATLDARFCST